MMKKKLSLIIVLFSCIGSYHLLSNYSDSTQEQSSENTIYGFTADLKTDAIQFVWKNSKGNRYASLGSWQEQLKSDGQKLVFAMNGGMYSADGSPKGLYIENGKTLSEIDLLGKGYGNFYMQHNGVLFITSHNKAGICISSEFSSMQNINYATQSGPMLLINGDINSHFRLGSDNKNIRNGVGLLKDGSLLFAMSASKVNFYDFANYFKQRGCKEALYLDGFVSRMYAPNSSVNGIEQLDGDFGVIIGVVK